MEFGMEKGVKERLIDFLDAQNVKKSFFEKSIGASNGFVNSIRRSVSPDKIDLIKENFPDLNIDWLLTGEGEMFKPRIVSALNVPHIRAEYIQPYINYLITKRTPLKVPVIPVVGLKDGVYCAFDIPDNSLSSGMTTSLSIGDIVICRALPKPDNSTLLGFKAISSLVAVLTKDDLFIKKISYIDNSSIHMESTHPAYSSEDITIKIKDILSLFVVEKVFINTPDFRDI